MYFIGNLREDWFSNKTILLNDIFKEQHMDLTYDRDLVFSMWHRLQLHCMPLHTWPQLCRIPNTSPPCHMSRLLQYMLLGKLRGPPRQSITHEFLGAKPVWVTVLRAILPCGGILWRCCPGWSHISAQPRLYSMGLSHMGNIVLLCLHIFDLFSNYFQIPVLQ